MPSLSEYSSDQILLDGERNPTDFHMVTQVSLVTETGLLSANTRTWSNANWVGFIGGVQVYILDGNNRVVAITQVGQGHPLDAVFITGDVANSGRDCEYIRFVEEFL